MAKFLLFFSLLFFSTTQQENNTYWKLHPTRLEKTLGFYREHQSTIDSVIGLYNFNPQFVISIVAPEISRYDNLKNTIEKETIELFYVNLGPQYSDFSVGYFQMKLSFIEKLEWFVKHNKKLEKYAFVRTFNDTIPIAIRKERVERVKSLEWELHYLCLCYEITINRFRSKHFETDSKRLEFCATAYNRGFAQSMEEIEKWTEIKSFPNEVFGENFPYGKVASDFYDELMEME